MGSALFGVGYEGRDLDTFVGLLREHGVTVLVDVRLNAVSRKPGFSKRRLADALAAAGIGYRHARALGNPQDNREPFRSGDVARGVERYRTLLAGEEAAAELAAVAALLARERVAVLCVERDHERCHRQAVLAALPGPPAIHLA